MSKLKEPSDILVRKKKIPPRQMEKPVAQFPKPVNVADSACPFGSPKNANG